MLPFTFVANDAGDVDSSFLFYYDSEVQSLQDEIRKGSKHFHWNADFVYFCTVVFQYVQQKFGSIDNYFARFDILYGWVLCNNDRVFNNCLQRHALL